MRKLPETENALVLRTDFSDEAAWRAVCAAIQEPNGGFRANVDCVSDPAFKDLDKDELLSLAGESPRLTFCFIVDKTTLSSPEHPILVIDLFEEPGRTFRVIPAEIWGVENNLSIANMDFAEFADRVHADGVFRGFPKA